MSKCKFYLINSKKSEEVVNGLTAAHFGMRKSVRMLMDFIWIDGAENSIQTNSVAVRRSSTRMVCLERESSAAGQTVLWKFQRESAFIRAYAAYIRLRTRS